MFSRHFCCHERIEHKLLKKSNWLAAQSFFRLLVLCLDSTLHYPSINWLYSPCLQCRPLSVQSSTGILTSLPFLSCQIMYLMYYAIYNTLHVILTYILKRHQVPLVPARKLVSIQFFHNSHKYYYSRFVHDTVLQIIHGLI